MRHEYALVITCIFVVLWIPAQILLHNHRYNNVIRSRGYFFLFIQNVGTLISGTATGLYAGLQEDFDCHSYLFLSFLAFPLFCLPFFLRVWEYCVNFHISRVRAKLSVSDFDISERKSSVSSTSKLPNSESEVSSGVTNFTRTSWFCRHRWLSSRRFLLKYFLIGSWVTILPFVFIIAIQHRSEPIYFEEGYGCHASTGVYELLVAFIFTFAAIGIFLVFMIRKARDTFHIKTEMVLIALTWLLTGIVYVIYAFVSTYSSYTKIPQSFIVLVSFFCSLFSTMIYPLILVYYHQPCKKRALSSSPSFDELRIDSPIEDLVSSLQLPLYRNAFHKFLTMQFCAESLLFYETVVNWRNSLASYSTSKSKLQAQTIYNHFLTEEGICAVNVTRESVNLVEKRLAADIITHDLFEEPLKETINLMFTNSYYPFLKSDIYPKSKGVSFSALV